MKKAQAEGYNYEKEIAKKRGKHVGGPGRPDYTRGKVKGEVKATARPVDASTLTKIIRKKITEVESKSGFTKPAKHLAKQEGVALRKKGKKV